MGILKLFVVACVNALWGKSKLMFMVVNGHHGWSLLAFFAPNMKFQRVSLVGSRKDLSLQMGSLLTKFKFLIQETENL